MAKSRLTFRTALIVGGFAGLLAGDAPAVGGATDTGAGAATWTEVKWPFPLDQWGTGRAFQCRAEDCGSKVMLYVRPKLGFCNCTSGVSDDAELDRVGDLELFSERFEGLREGQSIKVGWMSGRSRPYEVMPAYQAPRTVIAVAFNDKCDVLVASVVAERENVPAAERAALEFLNGDLVLRWAERELGL